MGKHTLAEMYYLITLKLQPDFTSAKHSLAVLYEDPRGWQGKRNVISPKDFEK